jgi:hypothetical protein
VAVAAGKTFVVGQGGEFVVYSNPLAGIFSNAVLPGKIFLGMTASTTKAYALGESWPSVCGTVDSVGGVEPKSTVDVYDAASATLQSCATSSFFPYSGYENYWAGATDGVSLFAAGGAESCGGGGISMLARIDSFTGARIDWVTEPGGCVGRSLTWGMTMLNGNLYLAGYSNLTSEDGQDRPVVMRYTQSLIRDWKKRPSDVSGVFFSITSLGNAVYVVGQAYAASGVHYLIEKYDESGNRIWTRQSSGGGDTSLRGIVAVGSKLYAAGYTNTTGAGGYDVLLVEIDPGTGSILSTTTYGGAQDDLAYGIAVDGSDLYVAGSSRSFASAEGNALGQSDVLLLRYITSAANLAPTASAGANQTVRPGVTVQLNGNGSFDDNTPPPLLGYSWSITGRPAGSTADLIGASTATPTFTPDLTGDYTVRLIVTDQAGLSSAPSELQLGENPPPIVNAGLDQLVIVGSTVTLTGSASDANGETPTFEWSFTAKPGGSVSEFSHETELATTFVPDTAGIYVATLLASDLLGPGLPDNAQITAMTPSGYSETQTQSAAAAIGELPRSSVTSPGNQNALTQFLNNVIAALDAGDLNTARQQLQQAISRTDGCALRGVPDGNGPGRDWITTCDAQAPVYSRLISALAAITP